MTCASQPDSAERTLHYQLPSNQIRIGQAFPRTDQGHGSDLQLYRKMTPRRIIDKFGIDQTKYSAFVLSSSVYPTGVRVSFLSDGHPLKCGFNVVERRITENSFSSGTAQSKHQATNKTLHKIPVVEFLETPGDSLTYNLSKTIGNCDDILYKSYNGNTKIVATECSLRKNEINGIERDKKSSTFKNKILHKVCPDDEGAAVLRGRRWEFFQQKGRQCRSVQQRIGYRNSSCRLQSHYRCQTTSLPLISLSRQPLPVTFAKTEGHRKTPAVAPGSNVFTGTEVLSGVGIFNGHLKEIVQKKDGKDVAASRRCNKIRRQRMVSKIDDVIGKLELASLEVGPDKVKVQAPGHRNVTPRTPHDRLRMTEKHSIKNSSKQTRHYSEDGRWLKTETGKYRPYSKTNLQDPAITTRMWKLEEKPHMSVEPYLNYVGSVGNTRATKPTSHESLNYDFRRRLTLNSPVSDYGDVVLLSSWYSREDLSNTKTPQSNGEIGCSNEDLHNIVSR